MVWVFSFRRLFKHIDAFQYDMLTTPITTPQYQSSVLNLLSGYLHQIEAGVSPEDLPMPLVAPLTPLDSNLDPHTLSTEMQSRTIAVTSPWIDLASPDPIIAGLSRQVFNQELAYAAFCGLSNVLIAGPAVSSLAKDAGVSLFSRSIQEALSIGPYLQLSILLPASGVQNSEENEDSGRLSTFTRAQYEEGSVVNFEPSELDSWEVWNTIRSTCKYSSRLSVALTLPSQTLSATVQSRWHSEPIRIFNLPKGAFVLNKVGQPVLSKLQQYLVARYMRLKLPPWILLSDVGPIPGIGDPEQLVSLPGPLSPLAAADASSSGASRSPTPAEASEMRKLEGENRRKVRVQNDPVPHLSYIRHLQRHQPPKSIIERFGAGYQDYLQTPLQPLADNLESITYEVFEKDPIKYEWYERAIRQALIDWQEEQKPGSSPTGDIVVAVVGAGRGPLVTKALQASRDTGIPISMWAVEKNPNAYVVLQRQNLVAWEQQVTVVKSDMRAWRGPSLPDGSNGYVDILVSELLGSFADNELSPECLDGVQHVLNPVNGISIPKSYTAHLTPIATPRLHADILARSATADDAFETPYVVMLHAIDYLSTARSSDHEAKSTRSVDMNLVSADVQTCWSFSHPAPSLVLEQSNLRRGGGVDGGAAGVTGGDGANEHNNRFCRLRFQCENRGVCHGLAGYFETVLYEGADENIELSTNPITMDAKSKDMISWFPIFFPLKVHDPRTSVEVSN